jgi:FkbM family methyltransferase
MNQLESIAKKYSNNEYSKSDYIDEMYKFHQLLFDYSEFIKNTGISKIEIFDNDVIMTFRDSNVKMNCIEGDKRIACLDSLNFLSYELEELNMQYNLISKDDVIFDIGGNYGWYAMHLAKKFPISKIISFEPIPKTHNQFLKNINYNNISNIEVHNFGLSDKPGSFSFYFDPNLSVNASLSNVSESKSAVEIICKVDTLDDFVQKTNTKKIDFIKCDIEGAELFALKGSINSLVKYQPKLFVEMLRKWTFKFNYHPNDIIEFLKEIGYRCFFINGEKLIEIFEITNSTIETNFIFLHEEKHQDSISQFL